MKQTKFRAWVKPGKMVYDVVPFQWDYCINIMWHKCIGSNGSGMLGSGGSEATFEVGGFAYQGEQEKSLMQFTGFLDKKKKEVYESDIFRVEEDGEEDDQIYYLIIVWIKEWGMFGTLNISNGEYEKYLMEGAKSLDEPMFWTYTLEDTDSRKFYLCGNIFQNPELLER